MKAYITKYALKRGIIEVEGDIAPNGKHFIYKEDGWLYCVPYTSWYNNLDSAIIECERIVSKKIASLEKQIEILKNKTF